MKLACLALLLLPSLASADDSYKTIVDGHIGAAAIAPDAGEDLNSGVTPYVDGEAGLRFEHVDITAFAAYMTKHVDEEMPDDILYDGPTFEHYRMHLIDAGGRLGLHGAHAYGSFGVALESLIERGTDHVSPTSSTGPQPSYDRSHHYFEQRALYELRGGYTMANHVDVFGALTFSKNDYETVLSARVGIGYRF